MSTNKILKNYISEIDQFMQEFDKQHPGLSLSQQKEIAKAKRVAKRRDEAVSASAAAPKKIWKDF